MCFNYYLSSSNHLLYWTEQSFSMFGLVNEPHSWPQAWRLQINEQRMLDHTDSVPGQFLCYDIKIDFRFSHRFDEFDLDKMRNLHIFWQIINTNIFMDTLHIAKHLDTCGKSNKNDAHTFVVCGTDSDENHLQHSSHLFSCLYIHFKGAIMPFSWCQTTS